MQKTFDLNTTNQVENFIAYYTDFADMEEYTEKKGIIFQQVRDLDDLGVNLLDDIEEGSVKNMIYTDIIDFVRENYLNLADKDYILNDAQLKQTANLLYKFLCIDCFNIVAPRIIEQLDIHSIDQFDKLLNNKRRQQPNFMKKQLISNLSDIVENLLKLQKIDHLISQDETYKNLLSTFGNYLEYLDFSECDKFTENYLRPLLNKYFPFIIWRTMSTSN